MRRVVVTGIGLVTPLACGVPHSWDRLIEGQSGVGPITRFDASEVSCQIAGEVPHGEGEGEFNPDQWTGKKDRRQMDLFIQYGLAAAIQAVEDAGWQEVSEAQAKRTGVLIGSGIGGLPSIEKSVPIMSEHGYKKLSPFFIPSTLINLVSGHVSMRYGFRGPNHAVVTACSTGGHALGDAARLIAYGDADVMVAGSAESAICAVGIGGFAAARALSTGYNETPARASRPWDQGRDGFVMGEGAGVVVLEEWEHAKARGATIYGELVGYGLSGDAYHVTSPHPDGRGAYDAMEAALRNAKMDASEVDYINAHGTSTPMGDMIELQAVKQLFGDHAKDLAMSSTKSSVAHLLGGAGSVEAIFGLLAMRDGVVPPTLNLDDPEEACAGMNLVAHSAQQRSVGTVLSNSFGFGGTNVSLIFRKL